MSEYDFYERIEMMMRYQGDKIIKEHIKALKQEDHDEEYLLSEEYEQTERDWRD